MVKRYGTANVYCWGTALLGYPPAWMGGEEGITKEEIKWLERELEKRHRESLGQL